jgi:hypothetical protein
MEPERRWVIPGFTNGTTYTFTLQAVDTNGRKSVGVQKSTIPTLLKITQITAIPRTNKVTLSWTIPLSSPNFDHVEITYSQSSGAGTGIESTITAAKGATTREISGLNGLKYTFSVRGVDITGYKGPGVDIEVSLTPLDIALGGKTGSGTAADPYVVAVAGMDLSTDVDYNYTTMETIYRSIAAGIPGSTYISLDLSACTGTSLSAVQSNNIEGAIKDRFVSITLPDTVTTVGNYAFSGFTSLTTVSLPAATTFGNQTFLNCTSLTTISLPAATTFSHDTFYGCTSLTSVSLPAATTFGSDTFYGCTGLTSVSLPAATTFGGYTFAGCTSLTTVSLPAATTFGDYTFGLCTSLTTISLPAATTFGNNTFRYCTSLTTVSLPAATTFGGNTFAACTTLTTVSLPAATTFGDATCSA